MRAIYHLCIFDSWFIQKMAWLTGIAAKIGATALYNAVKGFFDSWFAERGKRKHEQKELKFLRRQIDIEAHEKFLKLARQRKRNRKKIVDAHRDDTWDDTLERMRQSRKRKDDNSQND